MTFRFAARGRVRHRGARVIQSAVAGDRLVITLETDGKIEVRTFDVNTLQPAGRLNFSGTP